jgi:hypothetical protein
MNPADAKRLEDMGSTSWNKIEFHDRAKNRLTSEGEMPRYTLLPAEAVREGRVSKFQIEVDSAADDL